MGGQVGRVALAHGFVQQLYWLIHWLVGELEGSPVDAEETLRADVDGDLDGFCGICVLRAHEPAGIVGADGKDRDERLAATVADFSAHLCILPGGVACVIDSAGRRIQYKATPESEAAIAEAAG